MDVTFTNLNYTIRTAYFSKRKKQILTNLNGNFQAGNLTAIMGSSGAGKSTLMNILAGFTTSGVSGNIYVNGQQRDLAESRRCSVYIMQDDNLQPLLTVIEAMHFAADLKLDEANFDKRQKVQRILKEMGLDSVHTTLSKNLSGGQRKRLSIALELIGNPKIIFLDEPTSGLDSVTSRQCFELLKSIAQRGCTVICIVHQPSEVQFGLIDHLYALNDGRCVYSGDPKKVVTYLSRLGFRCPTHYNPADYLLEVVSGEYGDYATEFISALSTDRGQSSTELPKVVASLIRENIQNSVRSRSSLMQIVTLIKRDIIKLLRDKVHTYLRIVMSFLVGLLGGMIFYNVGQDAAYTLINFNSLSFCLLSLMSISMNTTLISFPIQLPLMKREYFNRWYNLHSFYLANRIVDLPVQLLAGFLYLIVMYYMTDQLMEYERLGLFMFICFLVALVAQMVGLIVGSIFDFQNAAVVGPSAIVPTFIFSGFFVHLDHAHPALRWIFDLSFCKYGFDGVIYATYGLNRTRLPCSTTYCQFASPKVILREFGVKHLDYWFAASVLVVLYIIMNIIAYLTLYAKLKVRTRL